ncbi:MAG: ABC transporter ATP-binding protein/permease [Cyanobacteria bacterium]|nr:ABC transporter ATP-binding protein/permease [Cyanobacteriota bacterium]
MHPEKHPLSKPLKLALEIARGYTGWYLLGILALLGTNALGVMLPHYIQQAIDGLSHHATLQDLHQILTTFLITLVSMFVVRIASRQCLIGVGRQIEHDTLNRLFRHILRQPMAFFAKHPSGELLSRVTNDVQAIRYASSGGVMLGFNTLFAYATSLPMMWAISPKLTVVSMMLYPITIGLMTHLTRKIKRIYQHVQEILSEISQHAQESYAGIHVIQAYSREKTEAAVMQSHSQAYLEANQELIRDRVWLFLVMAMITSLSVLVVLCEGGQEVILKQIPIGAFVAFAFYLERLAWPTAAFGWALSTFFQGAAASERLYELLEAPPEEQTKKTPLREKAPPEKIQSLILDWPEQHKHLQIQRGELLVIVGPVGSGKTTLLHALSGLTEIPSGLSAFFEYEDASRCDIATLDLQTLRGESSLLTQQNFLFSTTIEKNLALGLSRPSPQNTLESSDIKTAVSQCAIAEEIAAMPEGYQTLVGERGMGLSGGQRQRLALARTLLKPTTMLLLDDPFSHIDSETEAVILRNFQHLNHFKSCITVIATHRLSITPLATTILVLNHQGHVDNMGTHTQLLSQSPLYQSLQMRESLLSS